MEKEQFSWRELISWRVILTAGIFGLVGVVTLWANFRVPIIPSKNIGADAREIFVVIGSALTGPLGGALAGGISALYSASDVPERHIATLVAHILCGASMGWYYRRIFRQPSTIRFIWAWARGILLYYFVLVVSYSVVSSILLPSFLPSLANPGQPSYYGYLIFAVAAIPEMLFIFVFTGVAMLALPSRYRMPVWKK